MKPTFLRPALFLSCVAVAAACIAQAACSDDSTAVKEAPPDSGPGSGGDSGGPGPDGGLPIDGGGDGALLDCFPNPQTHIEIINACTNAVKIAKSPVLARLYPDGGLPPLN